MNKMSIFSLIFMFAICIAIGYGQNPILNEVSYMHPYMDLSGSNFGSIDNKYNSRILVNNAGIGYRNMYYYSDKLIGATYNIVYAGNYSISLFLDSSILSNSKILSIPPQINSISKVSDDVISISGYHLCESLKVSPLVIVGNLKCPIISFSPESILCNTTSITPTFVSPIRVYVTAKNLTNKNNVNNVFTF